jgi:hypothetical protein
MDSVCKKDNIICSEGEWAVSQRIGNVQWQGYPVRRWTAMLFMKRIKWATVFHDDADLACLMQSL